jgi:hypothetical protein
MNNVQAIVFICYFFRYFDSSVSVYLKAYNDIIIAIITHWYITFEGEIKRKDNLEKTENSDMTFCLSILKYLFEPSS